MAALAVAMGVGRFAFTPLLPMMLHDGVVTLAGGSWLATANYLGYLIGALACMALPWWRRVRGSGGAGAAGALGLGHGAAHAGHGAAAAGHLACAAVCGGVASALVFLNVSVWCMLRLVALGQAALGGPIFCGPGWASCSPACRPVPWWRCGGLPAGWGRCSGC